MSFEMEKYFKRMNPDMPLPEERILELNPEAQEKNIKKFILG